MAAGDLRLPDADRAAAGRLLGLQGSDLPTRLGCGRSTDRGDLVRAAVQQLTHWQRVAAHPGSSSGTRSFARMMVRACERLVTATPAR